MEIVLEEGVKKLEGRVGLQQIRGQRVKERLIEKFFLLNGALAAGGRPHTTRGL